MDGSVADVLPVFSGLLTHLETERVGLEMRGGDNRVLLDGVNAAWSKLNKYYTITDTSPVYIVAVACDPRRNMEWIRWAFGSRTDWVDDALETLRTFYDRYRDKSTDRPISTTSNAVTFASWPDIDSCGSRSARTQTQSEFLAYLSLAAIPFTPENNPMIWWPAHRTKYSTWFKIGCDVLSIPAMSAEAERVFSRHQPFLRSALISSAKNGCTDLRGSLKPATIEAAECLRHWGKSGILDENLNVKKCSTV